MITYRRFNLLLLAIIAFLLCAFIVILSSIAMADDKIDWHLSGYVTGNFAGGAGYSPGIGVMGEAQARWKWLEGMISGSTAWQAKHNATFGFTYGFEGQLRAYVWRDFYVVGSYTYQGYESRFDNGQVWAKHGENYGGGIGWATDSVDINAITYNKETGSPNDVWFACFNARYRLWKLVWAMASLTYMTFDQMNNGRMERWDATTATVGVGVRW